MPTRPHPDDEHAADDRLPVRQGLARRIREATGAGWLRLIDIVTPPLCLACQTPLAAQDALCPACWTRIDFIRPPLCDRLGLPLPYDSGPKAISAQAAADPPMYGRARAVARYDGTMRALIQDLKFRDRHEPRKLFGRWLSEAGQALLMDAEILVPVPLHRFKLIRRRFNQAAILANELARITGVPSVPLALVRTRATASQVGLSQKQREENVRAAFQVPAAFRRQIEGRNVLLIDDVITTGATLSAATKALRDAGAREVDALALALVTDTAGTLTA